MEGEDGDDDDDDDEQAARQAAQQQQQQQQTSHADASSAVIAITAASRMKRVSAQGAGPGSVAGSAAGGGEHVVEVGPAGGGAGGGQASLLGRAMRSLVPSNWAFFKGPSMELGKRRLLANNRDGLLLTAPLLLWCGAVVAVYTYCFLTLNTVGGGLPGDAAEGAQPAGCKLGGRSRMSIEA